MLVLRVLCTDQDLGSRKNSHRTDKHNGTRFPVKILRLLWGLLFKRCCSAQAIPAVTVVDRFVTGDLIPISGLIDRQS